MKTLTETKLTNIIYIRERMIANKKYDGRYDEIIAYLEAQKLVERDKKLREEMGLLP